MADAGTDKGAKVGLGQRHDVNDLWEMNAMSDPNAMFEPGMLVRHPQEPGWGLGQVQSNSAGRVTVNFENAGKVVFIGAAVTLVPVFGKDR